MKIGPAVPPAQAATGASQLVSVGSSQDWADTLTMGQILKGRVLRQFGEGRYQLDFGGQTRIVDSAIPLTTGDLLHGKVVGLSGQVVLERLHIGREPTASGPAMHDARHDAASAQHGGAASAGDTAPLAGVRLDAADEALLRTVSSRLPDPGLAWRTGLFLAKHGLPLSAEIVRLLYDEVSGAQRLAARAVAEAGERGDIPDLVTASVGASASDEDVAAAIAAIWARETDARQSRTDAEDADAVIRAGADGSDGESRDRYFPVAVLLQRILNAQTGAAFQHRYQTLPVIIDGRLVEFDVALFDHQVSAEQGATRSRRVRMSLQTTYGPLQLDAVVIGDRIRMSMAGDDTPFLQALATFNAPLERGLEASGWTLEHVDYLVSSAGTASVSQAVIEHMLAQDSLRMEV